MRASPLIVTGLLLAALPVVGLTGGFGTFGDDPAGVWFGLAGGTAAATGWAARARTLPRAAARVAAVAVLSAIAIAVVLWAAVTGSSIGLGPGMPFEVYRNIDREPEPATSQFAQAAVLLAVVALLATPFGAAARTYAASPRDSGRRLVAGAGAMAPIVLEAAFAASDGPSPWLIVCVLSAAWLTWALRRARAAHERRVGGASPHGVPPVLNAAP